MKLRAYEVAGFGFALVAAGFSAGWYLAKRDRADKPKTVYVGWNPEDQMIRRSDTPFGSVLEEGTYIGPETRNDPKDIVWRPEGEPPPARGNEGLEELERINIGEHMDPDWDSELALREKLEQKLERVDIWEHMDPDWDWNSELALREKLKAMGEGYVVHVDEVAEAPEDHYSFCWTYFAGDNVVVDEKDDPVDAFEDHIGEGRNLRFGHGSGDPNVVYLRNEELGCDYEILLDRGSYSVQVLGEKPDRQDE